ncbi:hypothetical protein OHA18_30425 [Kribbella sp. NBC_00709]|uniref:TolB family protein n=1 Tax=Kribbella sp. NBC_00709 TaxID=2975972 RepID=UPI002E2B72CD|nr:hypothetical protein [Kribbella sp. NBC_00709]
MSGSGSRRAESSYGCGKSEHPVHVGQGTRITGPAVQRVLSPVGRAQEHQDRTILFATAEGGLSLIRLRDGRLTPITLDAGGKAHHAFAPGWSPAGTRIVMSLSIDQQEDIYTAHTDGTDLQRITNTPAFEPLADWGS